MIAILKEMDYIFLSRSFYVFIQHIMERINRLFMLKLNTVIFKRRILQMKISLKVKFELFSKYMKGSLI